MAIRLHDTRRRAVIDFEPLTPGVVTIYVCGPTVQSEPHIGHMRAAVASDIARRWLIASGFDVQYLREWSPALDRRILLRTVWTVLRDTFRTFRG